MAVSVGHILYCNITTHVAILAQELKEAFLSVCFYISLDKLSVTLLIYEATMKLLMV